MSRARGGGANSDSASASTPGAGLTPPYAATAMLLARLAPAGKSFRLSLPEVLAASVPVGIIASAWMVFLTACLTSAIGCVELRRRHPPRL